MEPQYYLYVSIFLFCIGIFLILTRRNGVMVVLGIELLFNAANLNFVGFSPYYSIEGQVVALFVIGVVAAEAAIILAILLNAYHRLQTIDISQMNNLKN